MSRLRSQVKRGKPDDVFAAELNVNGTSREFADPAGAMRACQAVMRVIAEAKQAKIKLGELSPIEAIPKSQQSNTQVTRNREITIRQLPVTPIPWSAEDGEGGLGGGLGGSGLSVRPSQGAYVAGGRSQRQSSAAGRVVRGGAQGVQRREQTISSLRRMLSQVLLGERLGSEQQNDFGGLEFTTPLSDSLRDATLFSRSGHRDYQRATFSFEFGLRDDPGRRIGNDWDLQYGNAGNHFHVAMVSDDLSRMVDLGKNTWQRLDLERLRVLRPYPRPRREMIPAVVGHIYLVHTVDPNTDLYALFRVERIKQAGSGMSCDITWTRIPAPGRLQKLPSPRLERLWVMANTPAENGRMNDNDCSCSNSESAGIRPRSVRRLCRRLVNQLAIFFNVAFSWRG